MIKSKTGQRLTGAFIFVSSVALLLWGWTYAAEHERILYLWLLAPPAFAIIGLGMMLFPIDVDSLQREHDTDRVRQWSHLPSIWRGIVILMFAASLANFYLVTGRLH